MKQLIFPLRPKGTIPGTGGSGLKMWQLAPDFMRKFDDRMWQPNGSEDGISLAEHLYRDLTSTNLPKLLRYEDRNSMAFSLESRLPFLDYRVVQMVFSLPLDYRIRNGWSKWIMRRSLEDLLPDITIHSWAIVRKRDCDVTIATGPRCNVDRTTLRHCLLSVQSKVEKNLLKPVSVP